jgi:uncharacterized SAM-binding protein YcdF (DUF218 family)
MRQNGVNRYFGRVRRVALVLVVTWFGVCAALAAAIVITGAIDKAVRSDVIIVLGAALTRDGKPYLALTRRAEHAAALWKRGLAGTIICTGGVGPQLRVRRSEADGCREVLMRDGVPRAAIVLEETSQSTEEQAHNSRDIMAAHGWTSAILVSDSYHVFRARYLMTRVGIDASLSPVPVTATGPAFYVASLVREIMALHQQVFK